MRKYFVLAIFTCSFYSAVAQKVTISGYVRDYQSKEPLLGVNIYNTLTKKGASTNDFGFYSISYNKGETINLVFSYIGYNSNSISFVATQDIHKNIVLSGDNVLTAVDILATKKEEEIPTISVLSIPVKQLKMLPTIAGEPDVIRSFQLMPGVQAGKEGTSGIYVRGGSPDQNLFLLDDIPLYNVSHIGGFLSTFDPNAISDVKLYKGGFPARYGGRLSSVVDLRMKDGNKQKVSGEVSVGTLATKFSLEGPIKNDTSSYFISARRCNADLVTRPLSLLDSKGEAMAGYTFYDLYGKYNKILKNNDRVFLSFYAGSDKIFLRVNDKAKSTESRSDKLNNNIRWGNVMASLRYSHQFSPKVFSNTVFAYTQYQYKTTVKSKSTEPGSNDYTNFSSILFNSGVNDITLKENIDLYVSDKHKFKIGFVSIIHFFDPGSSHYSGKYAITDANKVAGNSKMNAFETNAYVEDEWYISNRLSSNIGIRFSNYLVQERSFLSLQPRININYLFHKNFSAKASYVEMNQNVHLVSSSGAGLPSDIWLPATPYLEPEKSRQLTIGFAHTSASKTPIVFSLEAYYKTMNHLIEYKEGTSTFNNNNNWASKVEHNGNAEVYGIEFLAQKRTGNTTGWVSYTWSKNFRTFEHINKGLAYPYKYDRRHDFSLVINHKFSDHITFSSTWTFSTGNAVTLATNKYDISNFNMNQNNGTSFAEVHLYNGRNSYRMPAFHKLDVGVNFIKVKKKGIRTWNISVYNAYARQNTFMLYYKYDRIENKVKLYQLSLFPFIPSVSYSFRF
ncbi:MAG: TonB-dependent receptor plug domain-containing protein [Salinivirgaceae bacterium]|jgi:hypothetical protein|nr:TonB-dependent receptor plug domain-containing protein [Salinivirgaceae bacterium]